MYANYTNVSLHVHTIECREHLRDEDRVGNYDSRRLGRQCRSDCHVKGCPGTTP